ncbi:cell division protein FtsW (lipid II flippase) [Phytomonospora endophytica]|uniref:Cell division protein FtsW (Lipid II flippase) n=1 Tax=Phytomonospora endophytica TaxID=714109 RepID=A0A841FM02_9ACTN|nr:FtsW/RodA/SpoVE family cell cycle protein [Phytomonospora endophytica]MBB6038351.1 cell division protein FtsW (lipid II flippase) [Phytomonospora endophytica]GIG64281.1 putative FtsW-like protein [Phytomonospora endophytica]
MLLALFIIMGFYAACDIALTQQVTSSVFTLPLLLAVPFLIAHVLVRAFAPYADPILLPAAALLTGLGVVFIRRLDLVNDPFDEIDRPDLATAAGRADVPLFSGQGIRQYWYVVIAIVLFALVLGLLKDHRILSRYAYTLGLAGLVLVGLPAVLPASISMVNGSKLWIRIGGFSIQPSEFAKLLLLSFFAYYLVRKREVLSLEGKKIFGMVFPRGRDLVPVLVVWGASILILVFERDLGTSLMFFGMFVAMLYVATERTSWFVIGIGLFAGAAVLAHSLFSNLQLRVKIWTDPWPYIDEESFQLVRGLFGMGTGGLFGSGPGQGQPERVPYASSDFIITGFGEEIGLVGLTAMLLVYMMLIGRGIKAGLMVRDAFGKLLAVGASFTMGLQVFVIVGGVTKLIPLTGLTTPFLSYGGSSLLANWLVVALLIRISDTARRPPAAGVPIPGGGTGPAKPDRLDHAPTEVIKL